MTENYVGALVEVEIAPEYRVKLRVSDQTDRLLSSSSGHHVTYQGRKVTVIEPAPAPTEPGFYQADGVYNLVYSLDPHGGWWVHGKDFVSRANPISPGYLSTLTRIEL